LISGVALVQTLLMMLFGLGLVQRQNDFLLTKARQQVELQTGQLAASSRRALLTSDLAAIAEVVANLSNDQTVELAIVTDSNGRVLADSEPGRNGLFLTDARSRSALHGPVQVRVIGETWHSIAAIAPITVNNQTVGWAWLTQDITADRKHIEYVTIGGLVYTLIAAVAGVIVAILLARTILRPLRLLLAGAARVAQDRLDEPIPITTENEVGTVTRAFNSAMKQLLSQREHLLDEVARRTRAQQEADESNRAKDHFLAVLSHELRTPLTPVLTLAQMLERDPELSAELHDDIVTIRRNIEVEARLIDDLLDLTRISRNKIELRFANVDVHEKLRQVARMCQEEANAKQIDVELRLQAARAIVSSDATRLQQVFWNVLKNAVKFTGNGGRILVTTSTQPHAPLSGEVLTEKQPTASDDLIIEFKDNGVGIDPHRLPSVFNAFEQGGDEVTRVFGGLGLGLTISKALIDLHGGELTAHSEGKNTGATFRIRMPLTAAQTIATPASTPTVQSPHGKRRILLVEDHADTLAATCRLLTQCGYEVRTAGTVAGAISLARQEHFDLIVSDIGLPDGTGNELIRRLVAESPQQGAQLKGIAISGFGQQEDIQRSKEAGFVEHLVKPYDPDQLIHAVDEALENGKT
jgi:signal transduction histidine kinase/ActR/RegA family two-component response regulator